MKNVNERKTSPESKKVDIMSKSGAAFEFDYVAFDGNLDKLSELLGENYAGMYLFAKNDAEIKVLYKGESEDIAKVLKEKSVKDAVSELGATIFCYVHEDTQYLRRDIIGDIICE